MPEANKPAGKSKPKKVSPMTVVRDHSFSRVIADSVIVVDLGDSLELACLQFSREVQSITPNELGHAVSTSPVAAEMARVRLDYSTGVTLAMNILQRGIKNDVYRGDEIVSSIKEWVRESEAESGPDGQ
jgi:hypothetical protein